jgi:hypothetical protein
MTTYHGTFVGEDGTEFVTSFVVSSKKRAWELAASMYPESRCIQLVSQAQRDKHNARIYRFHVMAMDNYDDNY